MMINWRIGIVSLLVMFDLLRELYDFSYRDRCLRIGDCVVVVELVNASY